MSPATAARSESTTLSMVIADLEQVGARTPTDQARLRRAIAFLGELRAQAKAGIHANPKPATAIISRNTQGVLYNRDDDGEPYFHAFGMKKGEEPGLKTLRDGTVCISGLQEHTGVHLIPLPSGELLMRKP